MLDMGDVIDLNSDVIYMYFLCTSIIGTLHIIETLTRSICYQNLYFTVDAKMTVWVGTGLGRDVVIHGSGYTLDVTSSKDQIKLRYCILKVSDQLHCTGFLSSAVVFHT